MCTDKPQANPAPCALPAAPRSPERARYLLSLVLPDVVSAALVAAALARESVPLETLAPSCVALAERLETLARRLRRLAAPFVLPGAPWPPAR